MIFYRKITTNRIKQKMKDISLKNKFIADVELNRKIIYKICHFYSNGVNDFNDLYQEVLFQLWKSYPFYHGNAKLSTWIYKVSLNTVLQAIRKEKNKPQFNLITHTHYDIPDFIDEHDRENLDKLRQLIQILSDLDKAIITLYLDEFPYDDIANIIGISKTNVATKINRIKEKLKSMSNPKFL